jgi:hypothetical protein
LLAPQRVIGMDNLHTGLEVMRRSCSTHTIITNMREREPEGCGAGELQFRVLQTTGNCTTS